MYIYSAQVYVLTNRKEKTMFKEKRVYRMYTYIYMDTLKVAV